jgi:hypothetical protein
MSMYPEYDSNANRQDVPYTHAEQANMAAHVRQQEREEEQRNEDGPFMTIAGPEDMRDWRVMRRYDHSLGPLASSMTLDRGDVIEKKE